MPAPSIDGTANGIQTGSGTGTCTLTTTQPNDIIVVVVYNENVALAAPAVATVTSPGLTFARRSRGNSSLAGSIEIWWAVAASPLAAAVISIAWAAGFDDAAFIAFGVKGCNTVSPWDSNVSVPALQSNNGTWTPTFSNISTTQANDLLLFGCGVPRPATNLPGAPTGFTVVDSRSNGGGGLFASLIIFSKAVTATQSAITVAGSTTADGTNAGEAFLDALTADAPYKAIMRRRMRPRR